VEFAVDVLQKTVASATIVLIRLNLEAKEDSRSVAFQEDVTT
jgi:hypothetical protein